MDQKIVILTASRNRVDKLARLVETVGANAARPEALLHCIAVDDDDQASLELAASERLERTAAHRIKWHVAGRKRTLPEVWNGAWEACRDAGGFFIGLTDDYEIRTPGWDEDLRTRLGGFADGVAAGWIRDPIAPDMVTILCGTAQLFETLGYFCAPHFPYWFGDWWLDEVAQMVGRRVPLSFAAVAQGEEKGKTRGMWNLPFWWEYFHLSRIERRRQAEALRLRIHAPQSPGYLASLADEERFCAQAEDRFAKTSIDWLHAMESNLSAETGPPSEDYLEIENEARKHVHRLAVAALLREKKEGLMR